MSMPASIPLKPPSPGKSRRPKLNDNSRSSLRNQTKDEGAASAVQFLHRYFFPSMPDNYSLRKKIQLTKNASSVGFMYDLSQDFTSLLMCGVYVVSTYYDSYKAVRNIFAIDLAITAYVWYVLKFTAIVDIVSVFPTFFGVVYVIIFNRNMSFFTSQLISTLRLIRVIRIFKTLRFFYSVRRAVLKLVLTLFTMIFVTAGIVQFFESDYKQNMIVDCQYINKNTDWLPSCSRVVPNAELLDCDCEHENCRPLYDVSK
jgi:hypothetical protein